MKKWLSVFVLSLTVTAAYADDVPVAKSAGDVTYITGGIGEEERTALAAVKNDYNLAVISSQVSGDYIGAEELVISDAVGNELVRAEAGPLFYAKLPKGNYTLQASIGGSAQTRKVTIGGDTQRTVYFRWE